MPERPAVARRGILEHGSNLVDRARMAVRGHRAICPDGCSPAPLGIGERGPRGNEPAFDKKPKGDSRLLALVWHRSHRALVERKRRIDALASDLHIGALALDPDPAS